MQQPYRLEGVILRDVGVFEHARFDFPVIEDAEADAKKAEIHIFTGPNGCGKSTLLYALAAAFEINTNPLVFKRFRKEKSIVQFKFSSLSGYYGFKKSELLNPFGPSSPYVNLDGYYFETARDSQGSNALTQYIEGFNHTALINTKKFPFAAFAYSGSRSPQSEFTFSAIQNISNSPFEQALSFDKTVRPAILAQWIANNKTQEALALAEGQHSEAERYLTSMRKISAFIHTICGLDVTFRLQRTPLAVKLNINGLDVGFEALPEGLKSIISWVADLALRLESIPWAESRDIFSQPIILFLDEVDIHLHPKWQRRILPAIQTLLPNAQVFVSTHSPFVVGSVEDAWVYRLPDPQACVCHDPNVPQIITPEHSAAGKSYQLILEEVFGVEEQFDVETETLLSKFKEARNGYLANTQDDSELMRLVELLRAKNSEELEGIVQMELRQVARRKTKGN